jgi:DNA-binding transcriptional ArsR family regulator
MTDAQAASRAFGALADPMRRTILERLAACPLPVGELARDLPVTRPAVSQHLKILKAAGLVAETPAGTRRIYRIDPRGLGAMRDWLDDRCGEAVEAFGRGADGGAPTKSSAPSGA